MTRGRRKGFSFPADKRQNRERQKYCKSSGGIIVYKNVDGKWVRVEKSEATEQQTNEVSEKK